MDFRVYKRKGRFSSTNSLNGLCVISVDNGLRHVTLCPRKPRFKLPLLFIIRKIEKGFMARCLIANNYPVDWEESERIVESGLKSLMF